MIKIYNNFLMNFKLKLMSEKKIWFKNELLNDISKIKNII